jgi:hypothetical protein
MRVGDFRADAVLKWVGERFEGELHAKRVASLSDGVLGVVNSASLAVSAIGLALAQAHGLNAKHATKQVDRLLSNKGIDLGRLFTPWIRQAIGEDRDIVVAMDWSDFDANDQSTLMLSLVTTYGRAQPLLWLTVYKAELAGRRNEFEDVCLTRLKEALPEGVRPTILADRGFGDVKLMEFLAELGFAYVIRFRGDTFVSAANGETRKAAQWVGVGGRARKLNEAKLTKGGFEVGASVHVQAKEMKEAWHLAASDSAKSAKDIIDLYAKRWTIEPSFRDTKDLRFGMGMAKLRIADPMRRDRLLFLNALATQLLTLLGAAGESLGMDKQLRTSTTKRRTHSLFRQGCMWFGLIPNMPEHRLRPLIEKFAQIINQNNLLVIAFASSSK